MIPPFLVFSVILIVGLIGVASGIVWFRQYVDFQAKLHYDRGVASLQSGAYANAEKEFQSALKRRRTLSEARYGLGLTYLQQQRYREGIATLNEVVNALPQNAGAYYNLGLAYIAVGKLDKAQHTLETAVTMNPRMKEIHYNLSTVMLEKGDINQAGIHCANALQIDPQYEKARELHAQLAEIRFVAPINHELIRKALQDFDQNDTEFVIKL